MVFEGEYINGFKRKGKEYFNKKLQFEGEYINGIRWEGIGYNYYGYKCYELKNGNGSVKNYYIYYKRYEGEIVNGKLNGKGKEYDKYDDILTFEGEYLNGKRNGKGKRILYNNRF